MLVGISPIIMITFLQEAMETNKDIPVLQCHGTLVYVCVCVCLYFNCLYLLQVIQIL